MQTKEYMAIKQGASIISLNNILTVQKIEHFNGDATIYIIYLNRKEPFILTYSTTQDRNADYETICCMLI